MSIFDNRKKQRPSGGSESNLDFTGAQDVRDEVPEIEDAIEKVDRALAGKQKEKGCGCWG